MVYASATSLLLTMTSLRGVEADVVRRVEELLAKGTDLELDVDGAVEKWVRARWPDVR